MALSVFHEGFEDLVVVRVLVLDDFDRGAVEALSDGPRTREKDRRVCGNDELCVARPAHSCDYIQQLEMSSWREGRLGLARKPCARGLARKPCARGQRGCVYRDGADRHGRRGGRHRPD